jgi:hypothetical protein
MRAMLGGERAVAVSGRCWRGLSSNFHSVSYRLRSYGRYPLRCRTYATFIFVGFFILGPQGEFFTVWYSYLRENSYKFQLISYLYHIPILFCLLRPGNNVNKQLVVCRQLLIIQKRSLIKSANDTFITASAAASK